MVIMEPLINSDTRKSHLVLRGLSQHNLKSLNCDLALNQWIAVTGVSGSGKSSFAFDTLHAEGQRRYLEALAPWAKQLPRPAFDLIEGLPPTLAVGQSLTQLGKNQTVGSVTDTADLIALLFARCSLQHSPVSGKQLRRHTASQVVQYLMTHLGAKLHLLAPVTLISDTLATAAKQYQSMGFVRLRINGQEVDLTEQLPDISPEQVEVVVDRLVVKGGAQDRLYDSVSLAMRMGRGRIVVEIDGLPTTFADYYYCSETDTAYYPLTQRDFLRELTPQAEACLIGGKSIAQLTALPIPDLIASIAKWKFTGPAKVAFDELGPRLTARLKTLCELDLDYISLNRSGDTLSVGEQQRVQLAAQVSARLSGVVYILDEPSRGLAAKDIAHLITLFKQLVANGNTLIVVEHDPQLIAAADHLIELGPGAGRKGGQITYQGVPKPVPFTIIPSQKRKPTGHFSLKGVSCHNIHDLSVDLPLGCLVGFCGRSGSGKSTLVLDIALPQQPMERIRTVDQRLAGVSLRSTPATYVGLMTPLRQLIAETPLALARGYDATHFSLNRKGGRCEACEGLGLIRLRLAPLPDGWAPCDVCEGKRYNYETLQTNWNGHSMADILAMSVEEAAPLFSRIPHLARRLNLLNELGLAYLQLGQNFTTLSGGERQRLKLIAELAKSAREPTLYILDEPASGLANSDIEKLVTILHRLIDDGHTVWVIEHRPEVLASTDHLIKLGPGGGPKGGQVVYSGPPTKTSIYN